MKTMVKISSLILFSLFVVLSACKKDDTDNDYKYTPPTHYKGDVEGWVTVDGIKSVVSGGSNESTYGFIMYPRNMTPANSYPILEITFSSKPAADSVYDLFSINESVSVTTASGVEYFVSAGNLNVNVEADSIVATFTDLKAKKLYGTDTIKVSGSATYYAKDL